MRYLIFVAAFICLCSGPFSAVSAQQHKTQTSPAQTKAKAKPPQTKAERPAAESPATSAQKVSGVRIDGLYYADIGSDPGNPIYQYFRFYADSTGLTTHATTAKPEQAAKWLNKDAEGAEEGTYKLEGTTLTFVVGNERAYTQYSGTLLADGWILSSSGRKFAFVHATFPREGARPGENRSPKIAPVVSKMDRFDYDAAGRTVGVTTTIKISASDADGDPLAYTWTASPGSITGNGPEGVWSRPIVMGRPSPGVVTVMVTDGKGGRTSREFVF